MRSVRREAVAAGLLTLWLLGGFAVGAVVTMVASWSPTLSVRPGDRVTVRVGDRRAQLQVAGGRAWSRPSRW